MAIPDFPQLEEQILKSWEAKEIFRKTLDKPSPRGDFVFFDGPPTANGQPHIGHVETRVFKDLIPRFKTMQGYRVERKAGWDTQGLPVEIEIEKELGLSGKRDIEAYGLEEFNAKAKASVWEYKDLWEKMTERVGFWLDLERPYITYQPEYIETLWWILKQAWDQGLLAQDYKVVPYCPRCGTALSSHEVAQGYENVEEDSVYVKFELVDEPRTYVLAWTTTPWTLPGNVALAIDENIEYVKVESQTNIDRGLKNGGELHLTAGKYIFAKSLLPAFIEEGNYFVSADKPEIIKGEELVGKKYKPLFDFLDLRTASPPARRHSEAEPARLKNLLYRSGDPSPRNGAQDDGRRGAAYTIVPADFVTTEDGTGVVHTAVMYGEDDFRLGAKLGLPKIHTVDLQGKFNEWVKPWAGLEVRDAKGETQKNIIAWLKEHGKLYKVEPYRHDYPFCWRCKHPLLYYAKTSWFIQMSKLRDELIRNNEKINWYPSHIKDGRFGEWLREVKDWAISRERYWGTPLPIWECGRCRHQECLGSYAEVAARVGSRNRYILVRHGQSENNVRGTLDTELADGTSGLTELGRTQAAAAAKALAARGVTKIFSSQFARAKETAAIIGQALGLKITEEPRINEYHIGPEFEGQAVERYHQYFQDRRSRLHRAPAGGEDWENIARRFLQFLKELASRHEGETIVFVTHADPIIVVQWMCRFLPEERIEAIPYPQNGEVVELSFPAAMFRPDGTFDPHRPFIDHVSWPCPECGSRPSVPTAAASGHLPSGRGGTMKRIPEVADAWFDSGSMPFAQWHYPFENKERIDHGVSYPADYISEAIDQTRGWFYTLLAVSTVLAKAGVVREPSYKNVVVLGHIRDAEGKKLSKSLGNYIDPMTLINRYGADAIRWYLCTVNQPWDPKNFDTAGVEEGVKKTFLILMNVVSFLKLHETTNGGRYETTNATHPLDRWIQSLSNKLVKDVTERLENYDITGAARAIASFVTDLSTWYVRRSRDRFKSDEGNLAWATLRHILSQLSKLMAPFTPFLTEHLYRAVGGEKESVHLEDWPTAGKIDQRLLTDMTAARTVVEQGHALRAKAGLKVRQPLQQVVTTEQLRPDLDEIVRDELNVKELHWAEKLPTGKEWLSTETVSLDTTVTDELKAEGLLRDLIREFNALRKTAGLKPSDEIIAHVEPNTIAAKVIERYSQEFLKEVRAKAVTPSVEGATETGEIKVDGTAVKIGLVKT